MNTEQDHEHRFVDYGICEDCGAYRDNRDAAPAVADAAAKVSSALLGLVDAVYEHEQAGGHRPDGWSINYPAQRDMTEEAMEWAAYADFLREPLAEDAEVRKPS